MYAPSEREIETNIRSGYVAAAHEPESDVFHAPDEFYVPLGGVVVGYRYHVPRCLYPRILVDELIA
jgi:hypothetical protein